MRESLTDRITSAKLSRAIGVPDSHALLSLSAGEPSTGIVTLAARTPVAAGLVAVLADPGAEGPRTGTNTSSTSTSWMGFGRTLHGFRRSHRASEFIAVCVYTPCAITFQFSTLFNCELVFNLIPLTNTRARSASTVLTERTRQTCTAARILYLLSRLQPVIQRAFFAECR